MRQETGVRFPITYQDFAFLASWSGLLQKLQKAVEMPGMNREMAVERVYGLVQKGIVESDGECFMICQPWKECLQRLANADHMFVFQDGKEELSPVFVLEGEQYLLLGTSTTRRETILIEFADGEDFPRVLVERGYLPEELMPTGRELEERCAEKMRGICTVSICRPGDDWNSGSRFLHILESRGGYILKAGEQKETAYTERQLLQMLHRTKREDQE